MSDARAESDTTERGGAEPTDSEEFDAAWEEADTASDPNSPADEAADEGDDPAADPGDEAQPGSGEEAGDKDEAAGGEAEPPAGKASDDDLLAGLAPEIAERVKAALDSRDHTIRSVTGRLSAADRQLAQLRHQGGQRQDDGSGGSQGGKGEKLKSVKELLEADDVKAARAEYGPVVDPFVAIIEALGERLDAMGGTVQSVEDGRIQAHLETQVTAYEQDHPDWRDFAHDDRFQPWLQQQPRHIQEAAARNAEFIVDASEASDVLSRFKQAHGITAKAPGPKPDPAGGKPSGDSTRRDRQKAGAPRGGGFGAGSATNHVPDDFDAQWDAADQEEQRRTAQRR